MPSPRQKQLPDFLADRVKADEMFLGKVGLSPEPTPSHRKISFLSRERHLKS